MLRSHEAFFHIALRRRPGFRASLSVKADPARGRLRSRRRGGLRGAQPRRADQPLARPADRRRQQTRRRLEHRRGACREKLGRRLHRADREPLEHPRQPAHQPPRGLRARARSRRGDQSDVIAACRGGESLPWREHARRADRVREEEPEQAQLCLLGQRLGAASRRGAFSARRRHRDGSCPVQGRRPGGAIGARRRHPAFLRHAALGAAARAERPPARARHYQPGALGAGTGCARHGGGRVARL